ncbi:MAG: hypothetical protein UW11_C0022G0024 [Parcubacteria group bacterium GW2011_GWA2_43_9b]|uniref:DUF721 domain-containing protein n=2 Tax=Parcubacteria group TaxID=1794811 RepID=A0A1G2FTA3_9BACT|nr:MAG: hypothetical protein UW11_C0022G0024 [Parcubacteria group bacterium GW2011_GWA2_43_9b]OGY91071.1 MAG: hypothetical protein A3H70_00350 [Candidatus Komeilibacteria bacterium RIFCSPLOWO2_02_FULL_48_11]OGZ41273.1 MAG: hypothetical protein A3B04_03700 [Candidatus Portnoybacteria bacterium RIFCSPLOWO2_02_FULL_39_11]
MSWTSISWVIPKKIKQFGIERLFQFSDLKNEWDAILAKTAGDKFKNKSKPINLKNEVLVVDCLNSVWANELRLREIRILEEIKNKNSQLKINKISFIS